MSGLFPVFAGSLSTKMRSGPVVLELASEQNAIVPGKPFTVGLHIVHDKGFHTYWKYPGVVGVPTQLEWQLPEGFKAGPIQWPQPMLSKMADLIIYGYEQDTTLLVELTPPEALEPGTTVALPVKIAFMACADSCHPGFADMSLRLPVAKTEKINTIWRKRFDAARTTFAKTSDAWTFSGTGSATSLTLIATPKVGANTDISSFTFFEELEQVDSREPQVVTKVGDGFQITLPRVDWMEKHPPTRISGVLFSTESWLKGEPLHALSVRVDLE
ncbi:MAG: DsbC/DsbD-like thiol-disulfide interchange protein [Verrucomicrobiales bacterium]|jgi:DsbC/DsbD-like thiol-disulfide interchange protein